MSRGIAQFAPKSVFDFRILTRLCKRCIISFVWKIVGKDEFSFMKIIIVGCGQVGHALARRLADDGNQITVIDTDAAKINAVTAKLDVMGVVGNGANHAVQNEAGIRDTDLLIAVTETDELNMLACLMASNTGHCRTIARIKDPEYHKDVPFLKEKLGLAMVINPEQAAAEEIARVLRLPSAIKIDRFAKGRVELMKLRLPEGSPLIGVKLKDMRAKFGVDVLVCTVERVTEAGEEAFIAGGNTTFAEKDVISIIATRKNAKEFFGKINYQIRSAKDVMIVGGGDMTHYLTELLRREGVSVKIIEKDAAACDELTERWSGTRGVTVVNGAPDQELLLEEGIDRADAFVALTELDEENILLSLLAKNLGHGKVITRINRSDFSSVVTRLDLDSTIYPKYITADAIEQYVRATAAAEGYAMETLYQIIPGRIKAAEYIVGEDSPVSDVPLSKLTLKNGVLVAAIIRDDAVIIPHGSDKICAGDHVIIVTDQLSLHALSDMTV